jgi:putative ABC transport system substrate-binding protein
MRRREFIAVLGSATTIWPVATGMPQPGKVYKLGYLSAGSRSGGAADMRNYLRELGWIDGKDLSIEYAFADDDPDRLGALAAQLVSRKVDAIMTEGTLAPLAAKRATSTIPIVMISAGDPVGSGLVSSLARPGGNVTGMSLMSPDLGGKRLELLKELIPRISRVAVLWNAANPYSALVYKQTAAAAPGLGVEVQSLEVRTPADFDSALAAAKANHADALITVEDPLTVDYRVKIAKFAIDDRLPAVSGLKPFADAGVLMSYGADFNDVRWRAAGYVDKILKGAKPSDLPVEQPTKFELVINLKTANSLGLTIPPSFLARADQVIE